jgi:hypothetical protein
LSDAVPKKRGPKTDVLEALLKRVDGLEKRLHTEGQSEDMADAGSPISQGSTADGKTGTTSATHHRPSLDVASASLPVANQLMSPVEPRYLYAVCRVRA